MLLLQLGSNSCPRGWGLDFTASDQQNRWGTDFDGRIPMHISDWMYKVLLDLTYLLYRPFLPTSHQRCCQCILKPRHFTVHVSVRLDIEWQSTQRRMHRRVQRYIIADPRLNWEKT